MTLYYSLQIDAPKYQYDEIDIILGVKSNFTPSAGWGFEITEKEEDEHIFFVKYFLSLLEGKYEKLEKIGILRDNISVWMLYEYEGQCNMEFSPDDMYNLGKEGIVLCISCWENP